MGYVYTYAQRVPVCHGERVTSDGILTIEHLKKIASYKLPIGRTSEMRGDYDRIAERTYICLSLKGT
jgi:hypothetical protein